ncbi:MAG: DNA/RNA nuclease SfsA [Deltaproteobacteria bacterium]|jgi:sugar fermentation stimulation protein A|nr:DNA/RNA nuclease SfsA [Deltaproteobacteria bacterium]
MEKKIALSWPPLIEGRLIKRYKRFLADVELNDGQIVTCHTPNTGSMLDCSETGRPVYLSQSPNPKRRYPFSWEMIAMEDGLVGLNTLLPNKLAFLAFEAGVMEGFPKKAIVKREARLGASRLDLLVTSEALNGQPGEEIWVEVKSATLVRDGRAYFPDAVSLRGTKHLEQLISLTGQGRRALLLVMVQRAGAQVFSPADFIDPKWGAALRRAAAEGVEISVRGVDLNLREASLGPKLKVEL